MPAVTPPDRQRQTRAWGGVSADDRAAARRRRLLDAGLDQFGTVGYAASSVASISAAAGLSNRYFYDAFADREALLTAVYDEVVAGARTALTEVLDTVVPAADPVALVLAAVRAYVAYETADERRARVQTLEVVGVSGALERRRRAQVRAFSQLIAAAHGTLAEAGLVARSDLSLVAIGLTGATNELLIDWLLHEPADRPAVDDVIAAVAAIVLPAMLSPVPLPAAGRSSSPAHQPRPDGPPS